MKSSNNNECKQYIFFKIGLQEFCLSTDLITDVLSSVSITNIPLAPIEINGMFNLRGRVVTVISLQNKLSIKRSTDQKLKNNRIIVINYQNQLFGFSIDELIGIKDVNNGDIESTPGNLPKAFEDSARGIYTKDNKVAILLCIEKLMS